MFHEDKSVIDIVFILQSSPDVFTYGYFGQKNSWQARLSELQNPDELSCNPPSKKAPENLSDSKDEN